MLATGMLTVYMNLPTILSQKPVFPLSQENSAVQGFLTD